MPRFLQGVRRQFSHLIRPTIEFAQPAADITRTACQAGAQQAAPLPRIYNFASILRCAGAVAELGQRFKDLMAVQFGFAFAEAGDGAQLG